MCWRRSSRRPRPRHGGCEPARARRSAPMRAPDFWDRPPGLTAALLAPLGAAWSGAARLRRAVVRPYRAPVPVVCVGNLVAGGSGKTPIVLSLAGMLAARGVAVLHVAPGNGGGLARRRTG